MSDWTLLFTAVSSVSAMAFVLVAVLWLRKLRETVAQALAEAARQQVHTTQRMNDAVSQVQKQQRNYEQQLRVLSQSNAQLRQGLVTVASRLDVSKTEAIRGDQTVH